MKEVKNMYLISAISGACAMIVEVTGTRVIAPYLGNTIFTWASVIGLVLGALSIGYYFGGRIADKYNEKTHLTKILLYAAMATISVPILGKILLPFFSLLPLAPASILAALIIVPASFLYGMISPYIIKLTNRKGEEGGSAGDIFAISTIGSIIGTLGTGFLLIPNMQITHIFVLAAGLMTIAAWLCNDKKLSPTNKVDAVMLVIFSVIATQISFAPLFGTVIYQTNSPYYYITVADGEWKNENARVLFLDRAASSGERNGSPIFDYVKLSRIGYGAVSKEPRNTLVIGVAAGTQIEDVKMRFPATKVTGIEIDEKTVNVGKKYFSLKEDNRTKIIIDDARRFLSQSNDSYDLIIIDVFRDMSIPPHLATREFFETLDKRLSKDGIIVVNLISSLEGENSHIFELLYNTYSAVFKNVKVIPINKEHPEEKQNILLVISNRDLSDFEELNTMYSYNPKIKDKRIITDELNPIETYVN